MLRGVQLELRMGAIVAEPVMPELANALLSAQVTENSTSQGGFQLTFAAGGQSLIQRELLPTGYFDAPRRVILVAVMNGTPHTLIDGVITRLTEEQAGYIGVTVDGPFKTDSYKY